MRLTAEKGEALLKMLDHLEDLDDVQKVYTNASISDGALENICSKRINHLARILGIDPGSNYWLWLSGSYQGECETFRARMFKARKGSMHQRLLALYEGLEQVIQKLRPTEVAIEKVFVGASAQSALKLGQARGVTPRPLSITWPSWNIHLIKLRRPL